MSCPKELTEWQKENFESLRLASFVDSSINNVTMVAYYFNGEKDFDEKFWQTEFAILKTFQTQGVMPAVLVVNRISDAIKIFCDKFSIKIQLAENLIPGKIKTLALDMVENLCTRFDSDYVLTIQEDGFPLRPGLEEFVSKYDYIGAPWVRHSTYYDLYPYKYCVGNGGFSLRSKRLCEIASCVYKKYFKRFPYWWYILGDDTFYCKTLRFWFRKFVRDIRYPTPEEAACFSIDTNDVLLPCEPPLGFHSEGFLRYVKNFNLKEC